MSRMRVSNSLWIVSLLMMCLVLIPAASFSQDWAGLSKQLHQRCTKYNADVKDLSLVMEMKASSPEGDVVTAMTVVQKGKKSRAEVQMQGMPGGADMPPGMADMKIVVIDDGKKTWMISPMTGKMELPEDEADTYQNQWSCDDYLPADAEVTGNETISGRDCLVLVVKDAASPYSKLWVDKKTLDPVKTEMKPKDGKTVTAIFSDYKKLSDDWEFPYKTEMYQDKTLISTMIVKSIEINKGVSDDLFNAEKIEAKGPNMMDMMKKMKEQKKGEEKQE